MKTYLKVIFLALFSCIAVLRSGGDEAKVQAQATIEPPPPFVVVDRRIELSFNPERAFFLVDFGSSDVQRVEATLLPSMHGVMPNENGIGMRPRKWFAGAKVEVPRDATEVTSSLIVLGSKDKFESFGENRVSVRDPMLFGGSTELLREELLARKNLLRSWHTQVEAQDETLRRLRADADVIADLGRIVEAREEISNLKKAIEDNAKDQENLQDLVRLARNRPPPKNLVGRERELSTQSNQLFELTKTVENNESVRRGEAEDELRRKLALIEATRFDDYEELQRELIRIRKMRMDLEKGIPLP